MNEMVERVRSLLSKRIMKVLEAAPRTLTAAEIGKEVTASSRSVAMALRRLEAQGHVFSCHRCKPHQYGAS